jgi:AcrR family transcriptional regulator
MSSGIGLCGDAEASGRTDSRGEAREQAIIDATLRLLSDIGYEALTMDAVAAQAKASKATIYRRWPGKPQLVADALRRYAPGADLEIPETGTLRGDLIAMLTQQCDMFASNDRPTLSGLVHAMQQDPELADAMRAQLTEKRAAVRHAIEERAQAYGERTVGIKEVQDVMPALFMVRLIVTGEPVDEAFISGIVDRVVLPLLTRKFPRTNS